MSVILSKDVASEKKLDDLAKEIACEITLLVASVERISSNSDYIAVQEVAYFATELQRLRLLAERC